MKKNYLLVTEEQYLNRKHALMEDCVESISKLFIIPDIVLLALEKSPEELRERLRPMFEAIKEPESQEGRKDLGDGGFLKNCLCCDKEANGLDGFCKNCKNCQPQEKEECKEGDHKFLDGEGICICGSVARQKPQPKQKLRDGRLYICGVHIEEGEKLTPKQKPSEIIMAKAREMAIAGGTQWGDYISEPHFRLSLLDFLDQHFTK